MALGASSSNNGTSSSGTASTGGMASAMGSTSTASGGPSSSGNGGGNAGGNTNAGSTAAGSAASNSAAGTTAGDSKQNNGTNAQNAGTTNSQSTTAGSAMSNLQGAVNAARDARNQNISGTQRGIADAVANAFGASQAAAGVNQGTTSPNATPGQRDAYNAGYRNETNAGMTRSAFGALPGVGSLVGEGIARTAMSQPSGLADNEKSAYSTGVTGAKDAGIGGAARTAGSLLGGVLGGPIGSALASMALGGYSYSQQRAANPQAFAGEGVTQSQGPVTGSMAAALGDSNSGNSVVAAGSPVQNTYGNYGLPSDYSDAYNSYQNMDLGNL